MLLHDWLESLRSVSFSRKVKSLGSRSSGSRSSGSRPRQKPNEMRDRQAAVAAEVLEPKELLAGEPIANEDLLTLQVGQTVTIDVLANDTDAEGDTLSIFSVGSPSSGTVNWNSGDATISYTAGASAGTDTFAYTIEDSAGNQATGTITLTIDAASSNAPPVATADAAALDTNTSTTLLINVLGNDSDPEGSNLTLVSVSTPAHGTATLNGTQIEYWYNSDGATSDTFTYVVQDDQGGQATGTVTVAITLNVDPIANVDTVTTGQDNALSIDVLTNDTDPNGGTLSLDTVNAPSHGSAVIDWSTNEIIYTPDTGYNGSDSFTYSIISPSLGTATGTVNITVLPVGINEANYSFDVPENAYQGQVVGTLTMTHPTSGNLSPYVMFNDGPFGLLSNGDVYVTQSNYGLVEGETQYFLDVEVMDEVFDEFGNWIDSIYDSAHISFTITAPVNTAPVSADDEYSLLTDGTLTVDVASGLLANDTDANGDPLTVTLGATTVANGTLTLNADGSFTYTPTAAFAGVDTFTYLVNDGTDDSTEATVTIVIGDLAGETLSGAQAITLDATTPLDLTGTVGDGSQGIADVDLYQITLNYGETVNVDLDAFTLDDGTSLSSLDGHLRIFNSQGVQVASNADGVDPETGNSGVDSFVSYKATSTGTYYIGLSGMGNENYDATTSGTGAAGSTGDYELRVTLQLPSGINESNYSFNVSENVQQGDVVGTVTMTHPAGSTLSPYVMMSDGPFGLLSNGDVYVTQSNSGIVAGETHYCPHNGSKTLAFRRNL